MMRDDDSLQLDKIAAFGHVVETRPACMHVVLHKGELSSGITQIDLHACMHS